MSGPELRPPFPFSAVVGHEEAKLALLLAAVDPLIGGVLLRGDKGSAKTTLARGLARLLGGDGPFVELPLGAGEDRLVGSLDLEHALTQGAHRFRPGLLQAADGGVLYVDEVNLLPDHLVDVLLDVAASGVNRVERDGVSAVHATRFVLVGSMNPEEGDLRPQLLDRFGLAVDIHSESSPAIRAEAVTRRLAYDRDPMAFTDAWQGQEDELADRLQSGRPAEVGPAVVQAVAELCATLGAEGLRADLVICRAAAALAGFEGRAAAELDDVRRVAPLALAHRRRRGPFDQPGIDPSEIDQVLDRPDPPTGPGPRPPSPSSAGSGDDPTGAAPDAPDETTTTSDPDTAPAGDPSPPERRASPAPGPAPSLPMGGRSGGTRSGSGRAAPGSERGRLIGSRLPEGPVGRVALAATVQAGLLRRSGTDHASVEAGPGPLPAPAAGALVEVADLRQAVVSQRQGRLVILTVDASASMGAAGRMEAVKGAVLGLLLRAYQSRDRVALITFRDDEARVVLRPTASVEVARARLVDLPTGGRTPLAAGLEAALGLAVASRDARPVIVLVSDGRATQGTGADPYAEALGVAGRIRARGIDAVILDAEEGQVRLGLAARLAEAMGAELLQPAEWRADVVQEAIGSPLR